MMGRLMLAAALVLLLPAAAVAEGATQTGWTKITMPANDGFVVSYEIPPGWVHSFTGTPNPYESYNEWPEWRPRVLKAFFVQPDDAQRIYLLMFTFPSKHSLEDLVNIMPWLQRSVDKVVKRGFDQSFGRHSWSSMESYEAGSTDPYTRHALTIFNDRVGIEAFFQTSSHKFLDVNKVFDGITKSIAVTPVADLDADRVRQLYLSPEITFTPGNYGLDVGFSLAMPPGWQSEEIEVVEAGSGDAKAGRMIVEFFAPGASDDIGFTVQLDGTPYDVRLNAAEFLATRNPIVTSMADDAREVATESGVGMPDDTDWPFCLSKGSNRRFHRTGRTEVKTYVGKDPLTGEDVKLRIYTAGGFTLACNLIFRAPPEEFERLVPQVDEMVRSVTILAGGMILFK